MQSDIITIIKYTLDFIVTKWSEVKKINKKVFILNTSTTCNLQVVEVFFLSRNQLQLNQLTTSDVTNYPPKLCL